MLKSEPAIYVIETPEKSEKRNTKRKWLDKDYCLWLIYYESIKISLVKKLQLKSNRQKTVEVWVTGVW